MSNRKQVNFTADTQLYEAAVSDLDHGELSDELRTKLKELAYGADATERERIREQLETLREDRRELDAEIQHKKAKRDELDRKIERAERKLTELESLDGEYDGMLKNIEAQLHDGVRFCEGSPSVKEAAALIDGDAADVIADLKERNSDVPAYAFRESRHDEPPRWTEQRSPNTSNTPP